MIQRTYKTESELHVGLVADLLQWLKSTKGYGIRGADLDGYDQPSEVVNKDGVGDGENKRPDINAFDEREQVYVRGEAKTGEGDLTSAHTKTQLRLFANLENRANGKASLLYVIVPSSKIDELKQVLSDLGLLDKPNVFAVKSGAY